MASQSDGFVQRDAWRPSARTGLSNNREGPRLSTNAWCRLTVGHHLGGVCKPPSSAVGKDEIANARTTSDGKIASVRYFRTANTVNFNNNCEGGLSLARSPSSPAFSVP